MSVIGYIAIVLFLAAAIALPVVLLLVLRRVGSHSKDLPDEAMKSFSARHFLAVAQSLIFAVALVFLVPWAIVYDGLALVGLVEVLVFVGMLAVGYFYAWRKGAFEWV